MSDQDWLDTGHGGGEGLRPMMKGSSRRAPDRVSIRSVRRGSEVAASRKHRGRTKAMVGWLLYCCTAVGGTAAAFTVRDTLFPSLGAPTTGAVWANPFVASTLPNEHGSSSSAQPNATVTASTIPATSASATEAVEPQPVPSISDESQGPSNGVPETGTTVDNPSSGPGPGTTIADHPTDTSTPTSASTPDGADPTTASVPGDPGTGGSDPSGKGTGGGGGGGGDGRGGGSGGEPPTP